jgi:hypothetical protein
MLQPRLMPVPAAKPTRTLALGVWLARRGALAIAGFVLAAAGTVMAVVAAAFLRRNGSHDVALVPTLASECTAWSAGMTISLGAGLQAFHGEHEQGILALVHARCAGLGAYVRGRVGGLIVVLEATVGGATLISGVAALSAGGNTKAVVRATAAALAYALPFAATIGPLAMASLTLRTRAGGYAALIAVLVLPELLSPWTSSLLPGDWRELTSIPAALDAIRACVLLPHGGVARAARAIAGLAAVFAISVVVIGIRAERAATEKLS